MTRCEKKARAGCIEGESTNLILYSESISNSAWFKGGSTSISSNTIDAPNGTPTAARVDFSSVNDFIQQVYSNSASGDFTLSFWAKSTSSDRDIKVVIRNTPTTSNRQEQTIIINAYWSRYSITLSSLAENVAIEFFEGGSQLDFDLWGVQLENLSIATSYIPTTTAAATRSADIVNAPILNNAPLASAPFSVSFFFNSLGVTSGDLSYLFSFDNGAASTTAQIFLLLRETATKNALFRYDDGTGSINDASGTFIPNQDNHVIAVFDGANVSLYLNGVLLQETAVTQLSPTDTAGVLSLGGDINGTTNRCANANIRDLRIYDFELNADEITYLSGVK